MKGGKSFGCRGIAHKRAACPMFARGINSPKASADAVGHRPASELPDKPARLATPWPPTNYLTSPRVAASQSAKARDVTRRRLATMRHHGH